MYLPMVMNRAVVDSRNLSKLTENESKAERLLNSDGISKSFTEVSDVRGTIDAECQLEDINQQRKNNEFNLQRQKFQSNQILSAQQLLTDFKLKVSQTGSSAVVNPNFKNDIQNTLQLLTGVLNDRFGNAVTLSGSAFDNDATKDLTQLSYIGIGEADTPDTDYYTGGPQGDLVYINSSRTIDRAEITAEHPCFEKFIRALRLAKSADPANNADPVFREVGRLLDEANVAFGEALSVSGSCVETIRKLDDDLEKSALTLGEHYRSIAITDNFESFENWQRLRSQLDISRSLSAFQAQDNARFIEKILGQ